MLGNGFMSGNARFMKAAVPAVVLSFGSLGSLQAQDPIMLP